MVHRTLLFLIASFLSTAYSLRSGSNLNFIWPFAITKSSHRLSTSVYQLNYHQQSVPSSITTSYVEIGDLQQRDERIASVQRQEWINNSIQYYSKVMREERRRSNGQFKEFTNPKEYKVLAKKHYFALRKIKDGKPEHAECIYRRIINELVTELRNEQMDSEHSHCDHSKLAVTTLLLALHLQRNDASPKKTRSVFLNFFRIVTSDEHADDECACSAKVLQAFALFEMKQGNALKSLELAKTAIKLDPSLKSVLQWKQFRDATARRMERIQRTVKN
jgi:hypothetical protein